MSASQIRSTSASKQSSALRPTRSRSSDNFRASGIPLSRNSRTPKPLKGETPRRSNMTRSVPRTRITLATPLRRHDCKLPQDLKVYYTNIDEISYLSKIKQYVMENSNTFEITKPLKIKDFIGITQLFLSELCGPSYTPLNSKNYKTELPLRMKLFQYPIVISQSLLKSPNTPQNFQHVLSIWAFLMDLVEDCSKDWDGMDEITEAMILYVHKRKTEDNEEECRAELEAAIYASQGVNKDQIITQKDEISAKLRDLSKEEADAINKLAEQRACYHAKLSELNSLMEHEGKTSEKLHMLNTDIQTANIEFDLNKDKLENLLRTEKEKVDLVNKLDDRIKEIGHSAEDLKMLEAELERKQRRFELLNARYEESQERFQSLLQQIDMQKAILEKMIFQHNTKVALDLPKCQRHELYLNENEANEKQILLVEQKVKKLLSQAENELHKINEVLNMQSNEMVERQRELETKKSTVLEMQSFLDNKNMKLKNLLEENKTLEEKLMKHDSEVNEIEELIQKSIERAIRVNRVFNTQKEEATKNLNLMKEECIRTLNAIKKRTLELFQTSEDAHAQIKDMLVAATHQIPKFEASNANDKIFKQE